MDNRNDRPKNSQPIIRRDIHEDQIKSHIEHISREFSDGFEFLEKYPKSVTVFGSSLASQNSVNYKKAEELTGRVVRELGYAVITGGGPGIM